MKIFRPFVFLAAFFLISSLDAGWYRGGAGDVTNHDHQTNTTGGVLSTLDITGPFSSPSVTADNLFSMPGVFSVSTGSVTSGSGAITVGDTSAGTSTTLSHDVSGDNPYLVAGFMVTSEDTFSAPLYSDDAMVLISSSAHENQKVFIYGLVNPDAGTHDLTFTSDAIGPIVVAVTLNGVDQDSPVVDSGVDSGSAATTDITLTGEADGFIFSMIGQWGHLTTTTAGSGQTVLGEVALTGSGGYAATTAGDNTISWDFDGTVDGYDHVAATIRPAVAVVTVGAVERSTGTWTHSGNMTSTGTVTALSGVFTNLTYTGRKAAVAKFTVTLSSSVVPQLVPSASWTEVVDNGSTFGSGYFSAPSLSLVCWNISYIGVEADAFNFYAYMSFADTSDNQHRGFAHYLGSSIPVSASGCAVTSGGTGTVYVYHTNDVGTDFVGSASVVGLFN